MTLAFNHNEAVRMMIDVLCPPHQWWDFAEHDREHDRKGKSILCFKPEILQALRKRTGDSVIWGKNNRAWFKRKSHPRKA
jgi:hypothetical protein